MSRFVAPRPNNTKLTVPSRKPRNPLVAASLMRLAGGHGRGNERQSAHRDLQKRIAEISEPSP